MDQGEDINSDEDRNERAGSAAAGTRDTIDEEISEALAYNMAVEVIDEPNNVNELMLAEDMSESSDDEVVLPENGNETADNRLEDESDEEEHHFDITLAAAHSYMGSALSEVGGRAVLEPGWSGRVPALAHHGTVFPGETVPMLLTDREDAAHIARVLSDKEHKLFGLLCPDESGQALSGFGALCEVFAAGSGSGSETDGGGALPFSLSFKARALHRFRLKDVPKGSLPLSLYVRVRVMEVVVLADVQLGAPLRHARLAALDAWRRPPPLSPPPRHPRHQGEAGAGGALRRLDAAVTPWPHFVYRNFEYSRMRTIIRDYFRTLGLETMLPEEPASLSFWVASNLTLSPRDRLGLFAVDDVLLRLHTECQLIGRKSVVCCAACGAEVAWREHEFAMSSAGVHSNYTNPGGYMHDVVTVRAARNAECSGAPSRDYCWFPGYTWTVLLCLCCMQHIGWRYDAVRRNLRPRQFYGLCRNHVTPRDAPPSPDGSPPPP